MSFIRIEREGAVGTLVMERRERFNAMDCEMARDFRKAGLALARDPEVRAVVLRGYPGVFSSGADLKYIRAGGDAEGVGYLSPQARHLPEGYGEVFKQILEYLHSTISEIRRSQKPWIAAVDGIAAAGGFGIAMCCDLVLASGRSSFEWAYGKTALTGAESSTFMITRLLGFRRTMEMALLNTRIDAREALSIGLVNRVFRVDRFDDEVKEIAQRVAEGPTHSFGVTKMLLNQAAGMDRLDWHLDQELENLARSADEPDFKEGIEAFFGKRAPHFLGH
ncbi:MAG TPA: enoyl-CoA hydratase-related protein [Myxococcales bacterium]